MKIPVPITEQVATGWTPGWTTFFQALTKALGWTQTWSYVFTLDFGSVSANSQSAGQTVTIKGVREGDSVHITPYSDTVGITYKGQVTASDTVTINAINFTAGAINPASMQYRVVVIQN